MNGLTEMRKLIEEGDIDVLRTMVKQMAEALMDAEVDALCGASHGERHPERMNRRNGYRERSWDTRTGTIELALPKLRTGSYFPDWLLTPRKRSEQALVAAIADAYLAGVSTRRVDKLVRSLGIEGIFKERGQPPRRQPRRDRHGLPQPPLRGQLSLPCPRRPGG
jgi:transposase-like protein